ncbi:MAG: hypothetical protein AAB425_09435, partial [Bdellovibrionota bacterium]
GPEVEVRENRKMPIAIVQGRFDHPGWKLFRGDDAVVVDGNAFTLSVPMYNQREELHFSAVGPGTQTEHQTTTLYFKEIEETLQETEKRPAPGGFINFGLGPSLVQFRQSVLDVTTVNYFATNLTAKISYTYIVIPPSWDLAGNVFVTTNTLSSNLPEATVRFIGANVRFGYSPAFIRPPWRFSLLVGAYYTNMLVALKPRAFGHSHLVYPQLYPILRYAFGERSGAYFYIKYVPINDGFQLSLKDREYAAGLGFSFGLGQKQSLSIGLDASDFAFQASVKTRMYSRSYSASLAWGI